MYYKDTIAAVATPSGCGGIGIVRISGPDSVKVAERIFRKKGSGGLDSHRFYYGVIVDPVDNSLIDEGMIVYMQAPRSYTREHVVELHCHGGLLIVEKVLSASLLCGARLADPGEFTRRAFINGRIDLAQAEAVMDVISASTDTALALAQHQREGLLSQKLYDAKGFLVHALALIEAYLDFPEDDLGTADMAMINKNVVSALNTLKRLLDGFNEARIFRDGISVLIIGKPNAGKSSLLNQLLNEKRAIVTHIPGTTRDIIEETVNIGGIPVRLLDTAGIRQTDDLVEREGIERAIAQIPLADLVLFVMDSSCPFDADDQHILSAVSGKRYIAVLNKSDLCQKLDLPLEIEPFGLPISISACSGFGLDSLREALYSAFVGNPDFDLRHVTVISKVRHRDAISTAIEALQSFLISLSDNGALETLSLDLRESLTLIGQVTGETTPDDILDVIFSSFCIGK